MDLDKFLKELRIKDQVDLELGKQLQTQQQQQQQQQRQTEQQHLLQQQQQQQQLNQLQQQELQLQQQQEQLQKLLQQQQQQQHETLVLEDPVFIHKIMSTSPSWQHQQKHYQRDAVASFRPHKQDLSIVKLNNKISYPNYAKVTPASKQQQQLQQQLQQQFKQQQQQHSHSNGVSNGGKIFSKERGEMRGLAAKRKESLRLGN